MKTVILVAGALVASGLAHAEGSSGVVPVQNVVLAQAEEGHGAMAEGVVLGELTISGAFVRATLPNQPVGGGYLVIENAGAADRLVGGHADFAGMVQVHEMAMEGDVMKMRQVEGGLEVPEGGSVVLEPGGYHLMFMQLDGPLVEGESVRVTLVFEKAGEVELVFPVMGRDAGGHGNGHGRH